LSQVWGVTLVQIGSILLCVIANSIGQILLKVASRHFNEIDSFSKILEAAFNPYLIAGGCTYLFSLMLWVWTLRITPLSVAYPLIGLCFVTVPVLSYFILKESLPSNIIIGSLLILVGAGLVSR